jgi:sugar-phosphatase
MRPETVLGADAVLFDSDGVLVDSHHQVDVAWKAVAARFGLDWDRLRAELAGVPARDTLARHLDGAVLDDAVAQLEDLEVETASTTRPIAGAVAATSSLPRDAFAIVTSASRRLGHARWDAAGITIPDVVVTADDVRRGKPDPEPFLTAAARLGLDPRNCVVFEDSDAGGAAARAAGAAVVAVGSTSWTTPPSVRIPDLRALTVTRTSGALTLTLRT